MVSDNVYERLDNIKKAKRHSFSELFTELLEKPERKNWARSIKVLAGTWKESKEGKKTEAELKKGWTKWTKKYA